MAEIASQFGYKPTALNVMISRFHSRFRRGTFPPFCPRRSRRPPGQRQSEDLTGPEERPIADRRLLNLRSGRLLHTRNAGIFLFLPLLAKLRFDRIVTEAYQPGIRWFPPPARC